ncbi:B12-binding domain-containing protein [Thiomonas sp. FB-6]|uniref:MerR family transcriptional regulator n=1 Tax=Thiomonas sp. FB-6 TaxID=1158291 RepID=UPI00035F8957|nr:B12-binding domain-containing protein [Thiomonas sp. FB-6]
MPQLPNSQQINVQPVEDAPDDARGLSIAAVERDTGLSKDTLRMWERRYGFPAPLRNAADERLYPAEQVHKLQLLRRLMMQGHRPGRIVALPREQLEAMAPRAPAAAATPAGPGLGHWLAVLRGHDAERLRRELQQAQIRLGLERFVTELVAPLTTEVGEAWMRGELQVFEEHLYSETMHRVLRGAIAALSAAESPARERPRVLLTTMAQEPHGLGLLMAEAMMSLEGCHCVSLGVQTPMADMLLAVTAHRADVLALSFSAQPARAQVRDTLSALRSALPDAVEIWAGGSSPALSRPPAGVQVLRTLQALPRHVADWRAAHAAHAAI